MKNQPRSGCSLFKEGNGQGGVERRVDIERDRRQQGQHCLGHQFSAAGQAPIVLLDDLEIVVIEADEAEAQGYHDHHPDVGIVEFRPEEGGNQGGEDDHQAAHGGGAVLGKVGLGAVFPDILADLQLPQLVNEPGAHHHGDDQGGENGEDGPEGDVAEDIEAAKHRLQWI